MDRHMDTRLSAADLIGLARARGARTACEVCAALVCPGWESMPATFAVSSLRRVGTLRDAADEDPTVREYHPDGTHGWSVDAPIAVAYFPYNRCDAWQCTACARAFLRYTEYGGYYQDERIREVNASLVVDPGPT